MKPTYRKSWAGYLLVWSDLTLGDSFHGQTRIVKHKSAYNLLIIGPRGLGYKTYRKSWAGNLLPWSDFTLGFSFKVK